MQKSLSFSENKTPYLFLYYGAFILLFAAFAFNPIDVARPDWFETFQKDTENWIIGRIIVSIKDGFLSHGGLSMYWEDNMWKPHESVLDLQGIFFDTLYHILPFSLVTAVEIFHWITAAFMAFVMVGLVYWSHKEISPVSAAFLVVGIFFSPWFVVFGRNLFWLFGFYFLPMLLMAMKGPSLARPNRQNTTRIMTAFFILFFIKCGCSSDYLSTVVIAAWTPLCFYAYRDKWPMKRLVFLVFLSGVLSLAAFLIVALLNAHSLSIAQNTDYLSALASIAMRWGVRLGMNINDGVYYYPPQGVAPERWPIIDMYLRGYIDGPAIATKKFTWPPTFAFMVTFAIALSLFAVTASRFFSGLRARQRTLNGLVLAMWVGFCGALSWHILIKQHSYYHWHMNYILWYIPFALYLFILTGAILHGLWQGVNDHK